MIAIITTEQRNLLQGRTYDGVSFWNVQVKDINENWIIGEEEINACTMLDCNWVTELTLTVYEPKPATLF